ncbi:phage tail sheath C-terminal domain-containing protein [Robbsia sp. KACC 23696]|uniref:phage tail sheath family protein n=1 Tax=Robbsia sp. KACC 23696 TaxID=3149231 RepID=UPI00325AF7F1
MKNYVTPGVYVEEVKALSLSIASGDSAIPVIAAADDDFAMMEKGDAVLHFEIASWLDVTNRVLTVARADATAKDPIRNPREGVTDAAEPPDPLAGLDTNLGRALKAYFINGGGRAYVCKSGSLTAVVPLLSDVTLLVDAGTSLPATTVTAICTAESGIFGVLDAQKVAFSGSNGSALQASTASEYVATYYPWLKDGDKDVPPSAVMAGIYVKSDTERGVWQAPANIAVQGAQVESYMSDAHHGVLNDLAAPINVIRKERDGPPKVWGARTAKKASPFRYIQVRRLFNSLERDIRRSMKRAVFEPNTSATWETVRSAIDNYLYSIWRQGGLVGAKPEEAYRVLIGRDVTMTAEDIEAGSLVAEVAVAPVRPAEFVVIRFSEKMQG